MKSLFVFAAGLGYETLKCNAALRMAGLDFVPAASVFPAVTCVAQASFRTASAPREHGMTSNAFYSRVLRRPSFWEQTSALVSGSRIWEGARAAGERVGMYFWQQSMGESVDSLITPAPIHRHGGGMIMRNYTLPAAMGDELDRRCGTFPLHRYWGPLASAKVGRAVIDNFLRMVEVHPVDLAFLYLPTLDYEAQRHGPESPAALKALVELRRQLERLADFASAQGADLTVCGDYAIVPVTQPPVFPNLVLRRAGLFSVRPVASRAYPDFHASRAFAMCDHEIAHVYVRDPQDVEAVAALLRATGDYAAVETRDAQDWANESAGEILLTAAEGSWCAYPWWTDRREAPDWATHIDIHNKPGFDPCELFLDRSFRIAVCQDCTRIGGTHGRNRPVAVASSNPGLRGDSLVSIAKTWRAHHCSTPLSS